MCMFVTCLQPNEANALKSGLESYFDSPITYAECYAFLHTRPSAQEICGRNTLIVKH